MICFTIALRSKKSCNNWELVEKDFNNTLHSIFNQTIDEFEVFVACNEIHRLFEKYDDRLHFIVENLPNPQSWVECCRDRAWKQLLCAKEIRTNYNRLKSNDGVYVFPVDADDYVNCNIAKWCKEHPNENGFKSEKGYKWYKGTKFLEITKYYGGTMNIMKMHMNELPNELPNISFCFDKETSGKLNDLYPIRWSDIEVEGKFEKIGRKLKKLPFKTTIYVLGSGDNISNNDPSTVKEKKGNRFHPIAFIRKINPFNKKYLSKKIIKEFGINIS